MSYTDVDAVLNSTLPNIRGIDSATLKLVLLCIASFTNSKKNDHSCFPSVETLTTMTQLSQSAVSRAIDVLNEIGAFKNYTQGGGRRHSTYWLDMWRIKESLWKEPSPRAEEPRPSPEEPSPRSGTWQPSLERTEQGLFPVDVSRHSSRKRKESLPPVALAAATPPALLASQEKKSQKQEEQGKPGNTVGVSGDSAKTGKDKTNANHGTRLATPWRPSKPGTIQAGEWAQRQAALAAAAASKPPVCDCAAEWNGHDDHAPTCPKANAKAVAATAPVAAGKSLLGTVDEL